MLGHVHVSISLMILAIHHAVLILVPIVPVHRGIVREGVIGGRARGRGSVDIEWPSRPVRGRGSIMGSSMVLREIRARSKRLVAESTICHLTAQVRQCRSVCVRLACHTPAKRMGRERSSTGGVGWGRTGSACCTHEIKHKGDRGRGQEVRCDLTRRRYVLKLESDCRRLEQVLKDGRAWYRMGCFGASGEPGGAGRE
jgi:hypothetical protein